MAAERRSVRDIIFRRIEVDIAKGLLSTDTRPSMLADFAIAVTASRRAGEFEKLNKAVFRTTT